MGWSIPATRSYVPDPGYPIYESLTRFVGRRRSDPIRMANDFRLDVDELASLITPKTRLIVINSAGPTRPGQDGVLTRGRSRSDRRAAIRHDLAVLADEITAGFCTTVRSTSSIASLPGMAERTIVLDASARPSR